MVNQFITNARRQHKCNDIDQIPEVGMRGAQEDQTDLRELNLAFQRLPEDQRDALRLIAVEERSYEEVSDTTGCAIGTLKSRVHRAEVSYVRRDQGGRLRRRPRGPSEQAEAPHCQTDQGRSNMVGPNRGRNVRGKECNAEMGSDFFRDFPGRRFLRLLGPFGCNGRDREDPVFRGARYLRDLSFVGPLRWSGHSLTTGSDSDVYATAVRLPGYCCVPVTT